MTPLDAPLDARESERVSLSRARRARAVVVALALVGAGCSKTPTSAPPPIDAGPRLVIEGRVAWADRAPAEGVLVEGFREANDVPCHTTSGPAGAFTLTCPGVAWVRVVAIPQVPGAGAHLELIPDFKRYESRPAPYTGVELFANHPNPSAL